MLFQDGIGLEIAESRVAAVHIKSSLKGPRVSAHAVWPLDPKIPFRPQMEQVERQLKGFLDGRHLTGVGMYVGIPQEKSLLKEITLPLAARENLADTIRFELDRFLPLPEEDLYLDFQIVGEDREAGKLHVLLAAAKKADVSAYIELAAAVGMGISGIEPAAAGVVNALRSADELLPETPFALAICEQDHAYLLAGDQGALRAARALPGAPDAEAWALRIRNTAAALLRFRSEGQACQRICGGPRLDAKLFAALRNGAADADWQRLETERLPVPAWELLGAYGLALRALREVPVRFNLFPPALRKRPSRAGQYVMLVLAALALLTGLGWSASRIVHQRLVSHRLESEIQQLSEQVQAVERLQAEVEAIEGRVGLLEGLKLQGLPALDIIRELSEIIPESAWIREFNVSGNKVTLDGYADSSSELVPLLDASPRMTDVTFLSAITKGRDGKEKFRIGFTIVSP